MQLLPPWQGTQLDDDPAYQKPKKKEFIVDTSVITQGQTEFHIQRAQTFASPAAPAPKPKAADMGTAMHDVGRELSDNSVQKDPTWWQNALGKLQVLNYIDIPIELGTEVIEGLIPGKWAAEGTAERKDFEAWNALFGDDQGSIKERMDKAVDAFEKRPMWAQLGLGGVQIAATFGTGSIAKGFAMSGSTAGKIAAGFTKAGGYVVDPAELGLQGVAKTYKAGKAFAQTKALQRDLTSGRQIIPRKCASPCIEVEGSSGNYQDVYGIERRKYLDENWAKLDTPHRMEELFGRYNSTDRMTSPRYGAPGEEGAMFQIASTRKDVPWTLSPVLKRGNEFRRLFGDLWKDITVARTAGNDGTSEMVGKSRDLALLQLQLSLASRPGAVSRVTLGDLKEFVKTESINIEAGHGWRSGKLYAIDEMEAQTAVSMYLEQLEKYADFGKLTDGKTGRKIALTDDIQVFGIDFAKDKTRELKGSNNLINDVVKQYQADYKITGNARHIRNQRATELWLEGRWEVADLMDLLGHSNIEQTRGYLHDIDVYVGKPQDGIQSIPMARITQAAQVLANATPEMIKGVAERVDRVRTYLKAARAADDFGKRKGLVPGGAQGQDLTLEVGEIYLQSDELIGFMDKVDAKFLEGFEAMDDAVFSDRALGLAQEAVRLDALKKLSLNLKLGWDTLEMKRLGISRGKASWDKLGKYDGTQKNTLGKLQRAGYDLTRKEGKWHIQGTGKMDAQHRALRAEFAEETGFIDDLGDGLNEGSAIMWDNWARGLAEEKTSLDNILRDYTQLKDANGKVTKYKIHDVLNEYIDSKGIDIYNRWKREEVSGMTGSLDHFSDMITSMRFQGSGLVDLTKVERTANTYAAFIQAENAAIQKMAVTDVLDIGGQYNKADLAGQNGRILAWLNEPNVKVALQIKGLHRNTAASKIEDIVKKLAESKVGGGEGAIFGTSFAKWSAANPHAAKDLLEEVAAKISNNRDSWLSNYDLADRTKFSQFLKGEEVFPELRYALPGWEKVKDFYGINPRQLVGSKQSVNNTIPRIHSNKLLQGLQKYDTGWKGWMVRQVVQPLVATAAGGRAVMARNITKPLSARAYLYGKHERDALDVGIVAKKVMTDELGLHTDVASEELRALGIHEGNQWFGKLRLRDKEAIRAFESLETTRNKYRQLGQLAGLKEGFETPFKKIAGVTKAGEMGYKGPDARIIAGGLKDVDNMMRQVDVVLERILPEHWDKYFDIVEGDNTWHALMWMKEMQNQIDQTARVRGVDIVSRIQDKEGIYLANYFPRLYRTGTGRTKLGEMSRGAGEGLMQNNYVSHFEPRAQKDILDNLAQAVDTTTTPAEKLRRAVLEGADQRLGIYYETMMKEGTDMQTKKYILESKLFKDSKAARSRFAKESGELDNLERLFNDKRAGKTVLDPKRLERLVGSEDAPAITREFAWLGGDTFQTVARAQSKDEYERITKWIGDRRTALGYDSKFYDQKIAADNWLNGIFKQLPEADQRAAREQLEMVAPFIMKPLAWLAKGLYGPTNIFRTFKAGLDVGAPMIHGYNALVRLPIMDGAPNLASQKAWLEGVKEMKNFLWHPDLLDDYIVQNFEVRQRASQWVKLGHAEPLASIMGDSQRMSRIREWAGRPGNKWKGDKIRMMDRFEKGFVGYTDVMRIELFKAFEPSIMRGLKARGLDAANMSDKRVVEAYHEMGAVINKMTGVFDQELASMTPLQRILESSIVFFAPMYRRATYGIMADIFRGGMRRREALKQLSGVVGVGAMMGSLAEMTGNNDRAFVFNEEGEPDLTARFGKFNVQGVQVGIGTAWWTAFRMASDIAMMSYHRDDPIEEGGNWLADNPLVEMLGRRGRSQLAPGAGFLLDVIQGRTFTGDPLRDQEGEWDISEILQHTYESAYPFWMDGLLSGSWTSGGAPIAMTAELFGLQAYEVSDYDKLAVQRQSAVDNWDDRTVMEWRNKQIAAGEPVSWVSLPKLLQDKIDMEVPEVVTLKTQYVENYGQIATGNSRLFRNYMDKKSQLDLQVQEVIAQGTLQFERGDIDGRTLSGIISGAKILRVHGNKSLLESDEYRPLSNWFLTLRNSRTKEDKAFQGDLMYDQWQSEVVHNEANLNADGSMNWENYRKNEQEFYKKHGVDDEWKDYLEQRRQAWMTPNPILQEFETAKESLKPYWKAHDSIWSPGTQMNRVATWYMGQTDSQRSALKDQNPMFADIESKIAAKREELRTTNPYLDWLLVKWYGNAPRHASTQALHDNWKHKQQSNRMQSAQLEDTWPWVTPKTEWIEVNPSGRVTINKNTALTPTL